MQLKTKHTIYTLIFSIILVSFIVLNSLFSTINLKLTDNLYGGAPQVEDIIIIGIDDKSLQEIGRWPWNRDYFAEIINKLNSSKVIGIDVGFYESSVNDEIFVSTLENSSNVVLAMQYGDFQNEMGNYIGTDMLLPINDLEKIVNVGYVNIPLDSDGVSRSINYAISSEYESFSEVITNKYLGFEVSKNKSNYLINFVGGSGSFDTYSFTDVINNRVEIKNPDEKIILIGATAPDLRDTFLTPTSKGTMMPGVEIHANAINTLLLDQELERQNKNSILFFSLVAIVISLFILNRVNLLISSITLFGLILVYLFFTIFMFSKGTILNILYVPISILITYISFTATSYLGEQKQKKEIQNAFGKYLSPVVIDELIKNPSKLKLGGENRNITVFFSDIANFTTISEKLNANKLTTLLNEYLDEMAKIILKNEGLVDKFIGDAVMAFWGAPISQIDQTELAAVTAIEQQEKLKELRVEWKKRFKVDVEIRIGLSYGEALVGNMGSSERFDYTCIGDIVNLSSRLEAINKSYGTNIMVSDLVYERLKKKFYLREIDSVRVKGKTKPTKIYELICKKDEVDSRTKSIVEKYEVALDLYKKQKFSKAHEIFEELNKKNSDGPSKVFMKRCVELEKEKLPKNWDGVYTMTSK